MSLYESGESNGSISLKSLFEKSNFDVKQNGLGLDDIAYLTCRGGWPWATIISSDVSLDQAIDYYDSVVNYDIKRVDM